MREMTIEDFCYWHFACNKGRNWALATGCATMTELWRRADMRIEWRVWIATRPGVLDSTTLRLFACWCAQQVLHLATDERSRRAVDVAVRYAVGAATESELADARDSARLAAYKATYAMPDACAAAFATYSTSAPDAGDAALDASIEAVRAAWQSRDAANGAQAGWLMDNTKPNFELPKCVGKTDKKGSAK
jgi:hypothetical protein